MSSEQCERSFSPESLLVAGIPQKGLDDVKKKLSKGFNGEISCIGNPFKVEIPCEGDSGSPLTRFEKETLLFKKSSLIYK